MELQSQFNFQRLGYLLIRDIKSNWKSYAAFLGGYFIIVFLISFTTAYDHDNDVNFIHLNYFPFGLIAGGFLFTSIIFKELANPTDRVFYLGLPASNLEKILSKLLISNFLFIGIGVLAYFLFSVINNGIIGAITNVEIEAFNPLDENNLEAIKIYFVLHSIFFLGAIAFPRYALPKTILTVFIISTLISMVLGLVFRITFAEFFETVFQFDDLHVSTPHPSAQERLESFGHFMVWVFTYLTAPVLWIVSFFKLSEKEV